MIYTQGGGTARFNYIGELVFIEPPEWSKFRPGDTVPQDWNWVDSDAYTICWCDRCAGVRGA